MSNLNFDTLVLRLKKYKIITILLALIITGMSLIYYSPTGKFDPNFLKLFSALGYNLIAAGIIGFTYEWLIRKESRVEMENLLLFNSETLSHIIKHERIDELIDIIARIRIKNVEFRERVLESVLKPILCEPIGNDVLGPWENYNCNIVLEPQSNDDFLVTIDIEYTNVTQKENFIQFACAKGEDELARLFGRNYEWVYFFYQTKNNEKLSKNYEILEASIDDIPLKKGQILEPNNNSLELRYVPGKEGSIIGYNKTIKHKQRINAHLSDPIFLYKFPTVIKNFKMKFTIIGEYDLKLRMNGLLLSGLMDISQPQKNEVVVTIKDYCPVKGKLMFFWHQKHSSIQ